MAFAAGQPLTATDLNMTSDSNADATSRTTTSTSYTSTLSPATICGLSFIAPPSGKVLILWAASCNNSSAGNIATCSPAVRTGSIVGSGSLFLAADDSRAVYNSTTIFIRPGAQTNVTGLTAGSIYNVALEHRAFSAGTATFAFREVTVVPQLA